MNTSSSRHHLGPYALLAAARLTVLQQKRVCGWCLECGTGTLIYINGRMILNTHSACMTSGAVDQSAQCMCLDSIHAGDNPACPVHGKGGAIC